MSSETWPPEGVPLDRPNQARIYDYCLGGFHNFEADRQVAQAALRAYPEMGLVARMNRAFLRRVVRFLAEQGMDQFLDIGSGIPTSGNVHGIAQAVQPAAHVVYVDIDPVAVSQSLSILRDNPAATAIRADLARPHDVLGDAKVQSCLDFSRPMAVLFVGVLHWVVDDEAVIGSVHTFRDAVPSGSYVVVSHPTFDGGPPDLAERIEAISRNSHLPARYRTREQILKLLDGLILVEPGLVYPPLWRPEGPDDLMLDHPERCLNWSGVGLKP